MGQTEVEKKKKCPIGRVYGTNRGEKEEEMSHRAGLWDKPRWRGRVNVP